MYRVKLKRVKVTNFKSIRDSGWIDCENITTLVGVNEAGKSNILLALWKFNPAKDGKIVFSDDMPVSKFSEFRNMESKPCFIHCVFQIFDQDFLKELSEAYDEEIGNVSTVKVSKDYDSNFYISFPNAECNKVDLKTEIEDLCAKYIEVINKLDEQGKTEEGIKEEVLNIIRKYQKMEFISIEEVKQFMFELNNLKSKEMARSVIRPQTHNIISDLKKIIELTQRETINESEEAKEKIINSLPKFVYYSNYGNLDSEIYLPHVIDNLKRDDLTGVAKAKVRTLKVLFEYVGLNPKEILDMAPDKIKFDYNNRIIEDSADKIEENIEKTKERDLLLQSASSKLTREFREWWKQGNYIFRLQADGSHFRIWVSDDERPDEIVLENRSTGLQWFLSFYLVFLVESQDSHFDSIILLDEAGLSLHPLSQRDLIDFFEKLSEKNQIIHTTHSPFLVDPMHLERAKVVYVDKDGYTVASNDLRANQRTSESKSIYAVNAALGLSVSDVFLLGCKVVIVEGISDQYYLNAIKQYLIRKRLLNPIKEIVFMPSGGIRGINQISSLLSVKGGLPKVILDSDRSGNDFKKKLEKELYAGHERYILSIEQLTNVPESEVEDLFPLDIFRKPFVRIVNKVDYELDFDSTFLEGTTFNQSLEKNIDTSLLVKGYKVEFAKDVSKQLLDVNCNVEEKYIEKWVELFKFIEEDENGI